MKKNVLVVSGTRADFGLLRPVLDALRKSHKLSPLLLITGMHTLRKYGSTQDEVKSLGYKISQFVPITEHGDMLTWLSKEINGINKFCRNIKVDCILVLGDRDEMLAGAIVGTHLGIKIAHIHGGEITGKSVVDSKNRDAITQFATFHFAANKKSAERIFQMKQSEENIFEVGAPGVDLIKSIKNKSRDEVAKKFSLNLDKKWILAIMHPAPLSKKLTFREQIKPVCDALVKRDCEIIWVYPNSDTGSDVFIKEIVNFSKRKRVKLFKNLLREDFINLLATADVFIGNSSSGIIESSYLRLPVVNIGDRQKGRERSTNVIDCDYNKQQIEGAIEKALSDEFKKNCQKVKQIYGKGFAGLKIVAILEKKL